MSIEFFRRLKELEAKHAALDARVAVLEQKRPAGRPKKDANG